MHQFAIERKVSSIQLPRGKDAGDGDGKSDNDASSFTAESERLEDAVSFGSDAFVKVSLKKTVAVLSLLKKGVEVLFVDVDVTLKRNPIPILSAYPEDIIATSDIMFDKDEPKNINYRLNSGLFLVRPTPQVIEAFEQVYCSNFFLTDSSKNFPVHFLSSFDSKLCFPIADGSLGTSKWSLSTESVQLGALWAVRRFRARSWGPCRNKRLCVARPSRQRDDTRPPSRAIPQRKWMELRQSGGHPSEPHSRR